MLLVRNCIVYPCLYIVWVFWCFIDMKQKVCYVYKLICAVSSSTVNLASWKLTSFCPNHAVSLWLVLALTLDTRCSHKRRIMLYCVNSEKFHRPSCPSLLAPTRIPTCSLWRGTPVHCQFSRPYQAWKSWWQIFSSKSRSSVPLQFSTSQPSP